MATGAALSSDKQVLGDTDHAQRAGQMAEQLKALARQALGLIVILKPM